MVAALSDQAISSAAAELGFEPRLSMLVQREIDWRDDKRLTRLLKAARLKVSSACIEDIIWRDSRNLDRNLITSLAGCDWVRHARTVLLTGATGTGKTWLACALARQAARCGFSVLYARTTRLMQELRVAHGEGSFSRRLAQLARVDVLLLDDAVPQFCQLPHPLLGESRLLPAGADAGRRQGVQEPTHALESRRSPQCRPTARWASEQRAR